MRIIEILIVLLLGSNLCLAANSDNHKNGRIFDETFMQCSGGHSSADYLFADIKRVSMMAYKTARIGLLEMDEAVKMYKTRGLSPEMYEKLNSPGFYAALDACYSTQPYLKFLFIASAVGAEISSRVTGLALAALIVYMPIKFFGMLNVYLGNLPGVWGVVGGYLKTALTGGALALTGVSIYYSTTGLYELLMKYLHPARPFIQGLEAGQNAFMAETAKKFSVAVEQMKTNLRDHGAEMSEQDRLKLEDEIKRSEAALALMVASAHPQQQQQELEWFPAGGPSII